MFALVAGIIVLGCVAASFRRLALSLEPTALDPAVLTAALRKGLAPDTLMIALGDDASVDWERGLVKAARAPKEERTALVNEHLTEFDWRLGRWVRVPRICASIAASSGFMLATLAMRAGVLGAENVSPELREAAMNVAVRQAINVAALGMAGAAFCMAIQMRARRAARERALAADKLVEKLEGVGERA